jgi:ADP-heptose:LPS heptosyltransferase
VFGHGESLKEEPEYDENGDSNRTMFSDAQNSAKYPFYAFQKPVSEILKKNRLLFESQRDISNIVVIGHSFNEIDLPYFRRLADCASSARWRVYFYNPAEREHHFKQLVKCGVPADRFQVYTYSDLENESHQ